MFSKKNILIVFVLLSVLLLNSCHQEPVKENFNSLEMYISEDYAKEIEDNGESIWWKKDAGVYAKNFFPKYDEIAYDYSAIDFFITSYHHKAMYADATFVLELSFNSIEEYERAKQDICSKYKFLEGKLRDDDGIGYSMPFAECEIGSFIINIITEGDEKDNYPHYVSAMGFSDTKYTIRYIYLYDSYTSDIKQSNLVNCIKNLCNKNW